MTAKKIVKKVKSLKLKSLNVNVKPKASTAVKSAAEAEFAQGAHTKDQVFPIVGLGASAGGLKAFEDFFSGMPANVQPNMAFVLV